jgi:hypothetical protein
MFSFEELEETRKFMMAEFSMDCDAKRTDMFGSMLTETGQESYRGFMPEVLRTGNEQTIVALMNQRQFWKPFNARGAAATPLNCSKTFCETEFNHYYMRGLLVSATLMGSSLVEVYRAFNRVDEKPSGPPVGTRLDCQQTLLDLRSRDYRTGGKTGILRLGPNTGRSLRRIS